MKSALLVLSAGLLGTVLVVSSISACAESADNIPGDGQGAAKQDEPSASLPAPTGGSKDSGTTSPTPGTSTSSSSTSSSSGSTTSSSGSTSGGGGVPACSFAGDFQKLIEKASEIQAQKPCDATCNPTTHCCLDIAGGAGGGGGGGIPGLEAGAPGGGTGTGSCVSN